jgi:hypothetical protein
MDSSFEVLATFMYTNPVQILVCHNLLACYTADNYKNVTVIGHIEIALQD